LQKGKNIAEKAVVGAVASKMGGGMLGKMAAGAAVDTMWDHAKKNPEAAKALARSLT